MLEKTGLASREMFEKLLPSPERRKKGPYAVMECYEKIPCNPCVTSCNAHAVTMASINDLPCCDQEICTGCARCVSRCPGLACFVIDETVGNDQITITLPHEQTPLPAKGDMVAALNREGQEVAMAEVVRVLSSQALDHTAVITIKVDKSLLFDVRSIRVK
ncbi:MAG: 4Fe-4S ferredoxin [Firmicutes bacterium]|nr:4Fe-4S ferredoxin [Bacillota bacterium]